MLGTPRFWVFLALGIGFSWSCSASDSGAPPGDTARATAVKLARASDIASRSGSDEAIRRRIAAALAGRSPRVEIAGKRTDSTSPFLPTPAQRDEWLSMGQFDLKVSLAGTAARLFLEQLQMAEWIQSESCAVWVRMLVSADDAEQLRLYWGSDVSAGTVMWNEECLMPKVGGRDALLEAAAAVVSRASQAEHQIERYCFMSSEEAVHLRPSLNEVAPDRRDPFADELRAALAQDVRLEIFGFPEPGGKEDRPQCGTNEENQGRESWALHAVYRTRISRILDYLPELGFVEHRNGGVSDARVKIVITPESGPTFSLCVGQDGALYSAGRRFIAEGNARRVQLLMIRHLLQVTFPTNVTVDPRCLERP